jgi:hypothetical protein
MATMVKMGHLYQAPLAHKALLVLKVVLAPLYIYKQTKETKVILARRGLLV